jgi:hypothetical protein
LEAEERGRLEQVLSHFGRNPRTLAMLLYIETYLLLSSSRHGKALMYLATKADLERNGHDTSNLLNYLGTSAEAIEDLRNLVVELIDGYHRFGALQLLRDHPELLLNPDLNIDWKLLAGLYPSWIKLDRWAWFVVPWHSAFLYTFETVSLFLIWQGEGM